MRRLLEVFKSYLIKVFSDLHNAVIGAILGAILLGGGGIYIYAKTLWQKLVYIAQLPTPLWATILIVIMYYLYFRLFTFSTITESCPSIRGNDNVLTKLSDESINVLKEICEVEEHLAQISPSSPRKLLKADFLSSEYLSNKVGTSTQRIQYHFDQLNSAKLIHFYPNREMSGITAKGRALLHEKGLLP